MANVIPAVADINIPPHVKVELTANFESLMAEIGRRSMMGYAGEVFFGTAFLQGSRLQFTTAMPMQKMLDVSKTDRSRKKAGIVEVTEHSKSTTGTGARQASPQLPAKHRLHRGQVHPPLVHVQLRRGAGR